MIAQQAGAVNMLTLDSFFHLPQLDPLIERFVADGPDVSLIVGLDPRLPASTAAEGGFLPSGRATVFRILVRQVMVAHPLMQAIVVAQDREAFRVPRPFYRRMRVLLVQPPLTYAEWIAEATRRRPGLLAIDRLDAQTAAPAFRATRAGIRVISQLDTVFRGAEVLHHLRDLGVAVEDLSHLSWVIGTQRLSTLCPQCKVPASPSGAQLEALRRRYPDLADLLHGEPGRMGMEGGPAFYHAPGCPECRHTGRRGDVALFDVYHAGGAEVGGRQGSSLLSLEEYILRLAMLGHLSLDDLLGIERDQLRRTYAMLAAREQALGEANAALERKVVELEASNRVLQHRTEALISLQDIGQTLISSGDLNDLASRVCWRARQLCGAERAILYYLRSADEAEILAVGGWNPSLVHRRLDAALVFGAEEGNQTAPFAGWPPGVLSDGSSGEKLALAGLRVPLMTQQERVGLMIVQCAQKTSFAPGEVALLQAFANQAALAVQREGLIEQLRAKIAELEAAQAELVKKERMEQELELARQVQQSVLPRIFPLSADFAFSACNQPARQVGGDFYDVILLDADRFGLVIADVSDKGMPAALYMALTRSLLLAEARHEIWRQEGGSRAGPEVRSPRAVLQSVNRLLRELGEPSLFVSVFYGVLEGGSRRLTYARAGHDRPLLLRQGAVQTLGGAGACLGVFEPQDLHLSEEQIVLAPGDRLVLYTDGLTDVLSLGGELFGLSRFQSLLLSHADLEPEELCAAAFAELAAYQGSSDQHDDMTMLVVGVR